jgi:hypothetical protein
LRRKREERRGRKKIGAIWSIFKKKHRKGTQWHISNF